MFVSELFVGATVVFTFVVVVGSVVVGNIWLVGILAVDTVVLMCADVDMGATAVVYVAVVGVVIVTFDVLLPVVVVMISIVSE